MTTPTAAVVRQARDFLAVETRWTRHGYAFNAYDRTTSPTAPDAVQWCMVGAIARCAGVGDDDGVCTLSTELSSLAYGADLLPQGTVLDVNDEGTYASVLEYMGRFADALEREEAA